MTSASESALAEPLELELQTGDRMTRDEFHRAYSQMPEGFRAELIGGVVYVASPLKRRPLPHHSFSRFMDRWPSRLGQRSGPHVGGSETRIGYAGARAVRSPFGCQPPLS